MNAILIALFLESIDHLKAYNLCQYMPYSIMLAWQFWQRPILYIIIYNYSQSELIYFQKYIYICYIFPMNFTHCTLYSLQMYTLCLSLC